MSITRSDITEAEQAKQKIEDALETLKDVARKSDNRGQFESYIVGNIEQACSKFNLFGNYSIECFISDLEDEIEDDAESIKALAISLAHDDMLDDIEGLKERLEYWENEEWDKDNPPTDDEHQRQCAGLERIIYFLEQQ